MAQVLDVLIGKEHIEPFAQISQLIQDDQQLHPYILAAQNLDIKPVLGNAFWTDLVQNRNSAIYKALLEGGTYVCGDDTLSFAGLNAAIASYTYARYVLGKNVQDTPFGMMVKDSEYTSAPSDKALAQKSAMHSMAGQQYLAEVVAFLEEKSDDYPKYQCSQISQAKGTIRMTGASKF